MPKQYLNPETIAPPYGAAYTHVAKAGSTVYIAGQVALDRGGNLVGPGDAEAQTRQAYANVDSAVRSVSGTFQDIVKTTVFAVGAENIPAVRRGRQEFLPPNPPPSTLVVVTGLARPEFLVEVEAIAVVGD